MDTLRPDPSITRSPSLPSPSPTSPIPIITPSNDDIEAVIQMATSSRSSPDGRPPKDTRTQLFVGNLPYKVRWQDLKDLFRRAGTVLRADVSLGPDNRSRGYGTVLLATAEDAGRAIDMFNGYSWQSRILEVRPDRLPPDLDNPLSTGPSPGLPAVSGLLPYASSLNSLGGLTAEIDYTSLLGVDRPSSSSGTGRNLFVGNLPFHCQWQDLKDLFRQAGTIIRADVALGQDGRSRGFGTVVFATEYDADRAVKMFNGYEYNGRALKVHYDKFSQSTQPMTLPSSPNVASFSGSSVSSPFQFGGPAARPNHIIMPSGYTLDFGPASGPTTPYEYPQLQMSMPHPHHTHSHIHQPQPSSQKPDVLKRSSLLNDVELLSSALHSTHLKNSAVPSKAPSTSSSSSESLRRSTSSGQESSSSVSSTSPAPESAPRKSPSAPHTQANAAQTSAHSPRPANHPHHPGPINIPPPPPMSSFTMPMPLHNMSPMGIPMSPHYYPGMSPLHHPAHGIPMTPHGLPPITPSMPPFTFLAPMPLASPGYEPSLDFNLNLGLNGTVLIPHSNQEGTPTGQFPQSVADNDDGSSSLSPKPSTPTNNATSSSDSNTESSPTNTQTGMTSSDAKKSNADPFNINPYFQTRPRTQYPEHAHAPQQHQRPHPHPAHAHLAQLTPFSPGVAMSPGTFWGRPGVAGPNPYLNLAVGAPVHAGQMSPGGFFFHPYHPHSPGIPTPGAIPGSVDVEIGSRGGGEPGGYFDSALSQGYFPPVGNVGTGAEAGYGGWGATNTGLEGEILKDKKDKEEDREREVEEARYKGAESAWGSVAQSQSAPQMLASPDWDVNTSGSADEIAESKTAFPFGSEDHHGFASRTQSMSSSMMKRPVLNRPDSDPTQPTGDQTKVTAGGATEGRHHNERAGSLQS
ncbi:hypothetical protein D9758_003393 [Tetrapyrgos nigripes]|uniref:RRM domain-containing protein n=1 Tax=Tetrapyrgos nigripes TaxID=182062 RepID=A0A8H5GUU7_9AGAR|nr:hypothetical protein D9758_003393 [Tetrapyrgos nigripes]